MSDTRHQSDGDEPLAFDVSDVPGGARSAIVTMCDTVAVLPPSSVTATAWGDTPEVDRFPPIAMPSTVVLVAM